MENITDPQESEKETSDVKSEPKPSINGFVIAFVIAFLIALWHFFKPSKSKELLIEKEVLRSLYGVTKVTLRKWIQLFCYIDEDEFATYCTKRKVTESEYNLIVSCLGEPTDTMPVRTKGEIVDNTEGSYETLRSHVLNNLDDIGISKKTYDSLNVFPPLIAFSIRQSYQKNVENATEHSF